MKNTDDSKKIARAYIRAEQLAKSHYENFPVLSFLIPKNLRKHVAIIYWFARTADDIADEGNLSEEVRLQKLNEFENEFKSSLNGEGKNWELLALTNSIKEKRLNPKFFYDLLSAFKQDVVKNRYDDFEEILDYCSRSANPVGRLILELFDIRNEEALKYSDQICTALQLTNFLQDTGIDYLKGRIYLSREEMKNFSVSEKMFEQSENSDNLKQLVKYDIIRIKKMFDEGKKLLPFLKGRLKYEIGWTVSGGEEILEQIKKNNYNVLNFRPKLSKLRFMVLAIKSMKIN
ncbi:MAG: squalene synthase HpnC [Ignavibacteria bacterium]|jgi:squalene synthase HpnC